MLGSQWDNKIKGKGEYDWLISNNEHKLIKAKRVNSVYNRASYYKYLPRDVENGDACNCVKFVDLQTTQPFANALTGGNNAYIEFTLTNIKGLYKDALLVINVTNSGTNTASLFSTPLWFSQIRLLRGGQDVTSSFAQDLTNWVETCMQLDNPYENWADFNFYGINSSNSGTFSSNTTIAAGATTTLYFPVNFTLKNTLVPIEKLAKFDIRIRFYPNTSVLYAASSNITLSQLQLNTCVLRTFYYELDNYEYSMIMAEKMLNFNTLVRRIEQFPIVSQVSGTATPYMIQATRGLVGLFFVYISTGKTNTAIDQFNNNITNIWIQNSNSVNIYNLVQLTTADCRLLSSRAFGGSYFLGDNSGIQIFCLPPFAENPMEILTNQAHHSPYLLEASDIHSVVITTNATITNATLNLMTFSYGVLVVDDNEGVSEKS